MDPSKDKLEGRFYLCGDLEGDSAELPGEEAAHALKSRRLKAGSPVEVFDGRGFARRGVLEIPEPGRLTVRFTEPGRRQERGEHRVTVAASPPKGGRMNFLVEKLSELGADVLVPTMFRRSLDAGVRSATSKVARWRRTAVESAKQCGRNVLMEIEDPKSYGDLLSGLEFFDLKLMLVTEAEAEPLAELLGGGDPLPAETLVLVGPEGGLTPEEIQRGIELGLVPATLGGSILRIETAALVAVALLNYGKR